MSTDLHDHLERNDQMIAANLDGLSDEELRTPTPNGGNSMAWLLGHIVFWRHAMAAAGGDGKAPPERVLLFQGLDRGDYPGLADWSVDEIRQRYAESSGVVRAALDQGGADTDRARQLLWHETYHVGQLGILRRVLGHAGVAGR